MALMSSCQPDTTCREDLTVGLIGELREIYYDQNEQPQLCTVWDSITIVGVGSNDTLYANDKNVKKIVLSLHNYQDSTQYILCYHGKTDTMTIRHTNTQDFVSVECGCIYDHELLSIAHTTHWMDSVETCETGIRRQGETNIHIWRVR